MTSPAVARRMGVVACLVTTFLAGCNRSPPPASAPADPAAIAATTVNGSAPAEDRGVVAGSKGILLEDVTDKTGIDFVHDSGSPGRRFLPEAVSGALALFDYDLDGREDLLLLGGEMAIADVEPRRHTSRLYRNEGGFRFRDVTGPAGIAHEGLAMGVAVGDYDADGDADLFITRAGPNLLLRNRGDGTFEDATAATGVEGAGEIGAGPVLVDADRDGSLDIVAPGYVVFDPVSAPERTIEGVPTFPSPLDHDAARITLHRNRGDGTFTDATAASGIADIRGRAMGVIAADHDDDGDDDVFVMNDATANFLLENDGRGAFVERGVEAGIAFDGDGRPQGNMGIDAADYDGDGRLDLHTTTFSSEHPTLYRNTGGTFDDATYAARVADGLVPHIKWGNAFADFDDDGLPDLFVATGDFNEGVERWWPATRLAVANVLLRNVGGGRFENVSSTAGSGLAVVACSRGVAVGDLDDDGRLDVVIANWRDRPTVLRNASEKLADPPHGWLEVRLIGSTANRDAVGARVRVTVGNRVQVAAVHAGRGYQGHHGTKLHFGLGAAHRVDDVEVRWPDGEIETLGEVTGDRVLVLRQGAARR